MGSFAPVQPLGRQRFGHQRPVCHLPPLVPLDKTGRAAEVPNPWHAPATEKNRRYHHLPHPLRRRQMQGCSHVARRWPPRRH